MDPRRIPLKAALTNANMRAFLRAIRLGEGTSDEGGYRRVVGGGMFMDYAEHPNRRVWIERYKVWSSAAGAYQMIGPTWRGLVKQYGFPDFTPECQDEAAVALIIEVRALEDAKAGRLEAAVAKCSKLWASLPGSQAGQRTEAFASVQKVYTENGGVLA